MKSKKDLVELASRAKRYDPDAFGELFNLYFDKLRRYIYYHIGDLDMAQELASEVFLEALGSIDRFDDRGGTLGAWLYGIAKNLVARYRKSQAQAQAVSLERALSVSSGSTPEGMAIRKETYEDLYRATSKLPDEQRDVVILRFIEGYDIKTVALIMKKRRGNVRVLQHRAMVALRGILAPWGNPEEE